MTGEALLHEQFCAYLKRNGFVWRRDRMDKRTSAATGSEPDFWVAKNGRVAMIEFKVGKNQPSPSQNQRFSELGRAGCFVHVARSLESAISYIEAIFGFKLADGPPVLCGGVFGEATATGSEPKFWLAHSNALGEMVVTKDQTGKWCGIRVATAEDKARFPRLPVGLMG